MDSREKAIKALKDKGLSDEVINECMQALDKTADKYIDYLSSKPQIRNWGNING